jgi:hypothetical protein
MMHYTLQHTTDKGLLKMRVHIKTCIINNDNEN